MNQAARSLNRLCAILVTMGALAALAGWLLHISVLTRLSPSFIPTQFNSALCFLFYGLGLGALNRQWRWLARGLAGAVILIGLASLLEHLTGITLGIDTLTGYYEAGVGVGHPGRMASSTAAALTCLGAALVLFSLPELTERRSAAIAVLGSVAAAVGLGGFLGFAMRLQSTSSLVGFTQMGFPTATLCLLAGINVLFNVRSRFTASATWLPIPLCAGLLALLVTLTQALADDQDAAFSDSIHATAQNLADETRTRMSDMFTALDRMANRWNAAGGTPPLVWQSDAAAYFKDYAGLLSVIWADPQGHIGRIARAHPSRTPSKARTIGDQILSDGRRREAAHDALALQHAQVSHALSLRDGSEGFLYISPLTNQGAADGFQVATIAMQGFFGHALKQVDASRFAVTVLEDGHPIYSSVNGAIAKSSWTRQAELSVLNDHWVLSVTPTPAFAAQGRSNLPITFFSTGLALIILITASFFFALRWRQNANALEIREQELKRSEERYELAVRGSGVGLWDRNAVTGELYLSPRVREIMGFTDPGYTPDRIDLLGRVHPHDIGSVGMGLAQAVQEHRPYDMQGRVRHQDGTYIWVRLRGVPVYDEAGTLVRVAGSLDDITALKKAEAALKASEKSFRTTMDCAPVGMALLSPERKLVKGNRALSALTGYSEEEMLAMDASTLFPDAFAEDRQQIGRLLSGEIDQYEMEQMFLARGGKPVWALVSATLARNPDGSPQYVVKQLLNISERREMDRLKSEFISVVSHELRTPLTAIRGSLGLMMTAMRDTLPPKALHLVEIGHRNSERLIALVNDILDMEKLAANRMHFEPQLENLTALAEQAVESTAAYAEKYKVSYVVENRAADLPVLVDAARLAQIFANLLSNAAKFSPEGGTVRVVVRNRGDHARVEVIDRGPGIPDEFKPRIFGRFVQADSSIARTKGGTGLGLHITRELVERMKGQIGFDSVTGHGTTFWVEFPIAEAHAATETSPTSRPDIPRVLHVEDDADLSSLLAAALKDRVELVPARTLKAALALMKSQSFAAVLLDVGMPDGSGLSLIEGIGAMAPPPPVIILSAREIDPALTRNAAATLVKSRIAESEIAETILSVMHKDTDAGKKAAS